MLSKQLWQSQRSPDHKKNVNPLQISTVVFTNWTPHTRAHLLSTVIQLIYTFCLRTVSCSTVLI